VRATAFSLGELRGVAMQRFLSLFSAGLFVIALSGFFPQILTAQ